MRKLLLLLLCGAAFGQAVRYDLPPVLNSRGVPIANPQISLCTGLAVINGTTCSIQAQSVTDITGATSCPSGSPVTAPNLQAPQGTGVCKATGDSLGNAGFWLTSGSYIYCVTAPSTTGQCYSLTVPVGATAGGAATITGTLTAGSYNGRQMCDQAAGADVGAKINTCIANTSAGGIADATGISGGTCTTNINFNKSITLWVGQPISGTCQLNINTRNVSIIGMGGQSDFSVDSTLGGTTWTYTGTTGNHINICTTASGCGSGLFIMNMTFIGNSSGTSGHGFASIQGGGASQTFSSFQMINVHFTQYAQDGIHLEDGNFNFNWYKVASFSNKGHGLLIGPNASTVSTGQFRCFACSFENNTGTDAGYGSIPSSNKLAQVRILGAFEGGFWGGTIADTPATNANGIGMELGSIAACPSGGPQILLDAVHFEQLGIGTSVAVDTKNNAIYNNACLGNVVIRSCLFVINPGPTGGNNRNAIVNDANTQSSGTIIGPGNVYSGGYVKGYDGSLEVGNSGGSVTILDDLNHLPSSAVVQNGGNQGTFFWNGGQFFQQLLRFGGTVSFEINSGSIANQIAFRTTAGGGLAKYITNDGTRGRLQTSAQSAGTDTTWDDSGNWIFPAGVSTTAVTNNKGLQVFNTTTTCTTAASVGATCTTAAISLPVAEADTSYRVNCTGKGPTAVPVVSSTANSSATQFTITIAALTAVAASFSSYDCTAGHN